jgi:hypothetical protein
MALGSLEVVSESLPFAAKDRPGLVKPVRTKPLPPAIVAPSPAVLPDSSEPEANAAPQPSPRSAREHYLEQRQRLIMVSRSQTMALRQLVGQRRANEELQNSFLEIERRLPPSATNLELVFADERQTAEARLTLGWGSPGLAQILPVASDGVSAIALSLFAVAARSDALIRIHLCSVEEQYVIDRWTIPLSRLNAGWTMLALTRALVGPPHTLELRLDLDGQADSAVSLHLGVQQPVEQFQVRNALTGVPFVENGVSMQVWCGDPFGTQAIKGDLVVADPRPRGAGPGRHGLFTPSQLAGVSRVKTTDAGLSFNPVSFVPYRAAIACHPPSNGVTIASLPLPTIHRVCGLAATIEVGNQMSRPVEFALAVASDDERARGLLEGRFEAAEGEALSDWTGAAYGTPAPISMRFKPGERAIERAYLATRMAGKGGNEFAWARFRNLSFAMASA